eukprot:1651010-Prymnesium_polylepis.1
MFLSKGYFASRNCLREVVATLELGKSYLFVHESDAGKGGGPPAKLQDELKSDPYRQRLFDGRRSTPWHRIADFQLVSLIQIAEDMLLHGPGSNLGPERSLYVPGSLLKQHYYFPSSVVLYVSEYNPGAKDVAAELEGRFDGLSQTSRGLSELVRTAHARRASTSATSRCLCRASRRLSSIRRGSKQQLVAANIMR